jgi:glycerophosphoryl diester phosphodiesterase
MIDVFAHRGFHDTYTENSINSFVAAAKAGFDLELDCQISSNGVLYCMHDATVDRTTNGTGTVTKMTSAQINALRLNDGSRVPHLADALDAIKPYPVRVCIEIKSALPGTYSRLRELTLAFGASRVLISSFSPTRLAAYQDVAPKQALTLNVFQPKEIREIRPFGSISFDYSFFTPEYRDEIHRAGLKMNVFSVFTTAQIDGLGAVDGIFTDKPQELQTYINSKNC